MITREAKRLRKVKNLRNLPGYQIEAKRLRKVENLRNLPGC